MKETMKCLKRNVALLSIAAAMMLLANTSAWAEDVIISDNFNTPRNDPAVINVYNTEFPPEANPFWDATRARALYDSFGNPPQSGGYIKFGVGNNYNFSSSYNVNTNPRGSTPSTGGNFGFYSSAALYGFEASAQSSFGRSIPNIGPDPYVESRFYGVVATHGGSSLTGTSERNLLPVNNVASPRSKPTIGLRSLNDPNQRVIYYGDYVNLGQAQFESSGVSGTTTKRETLLEENLNGSTTAFARDVVAGANLLYWQGADYAIRLYADRAQLYYRGTPGAMVNGSELPLIGLDAFTLIDTITGNIPTAGMYVPFFNAGFGVNAADQDEFVMDGFEFYQVPEPGSMVLIGLGAAILRLRSRKKG